MYSSIEGSRRQLKLRARGRSFCARVLKAASAFDVLLSTEGMSTTGLEALRKLTGLEVGSLTYHLVLTGNPGTGKTEVAQAVGTLLFDIGATTEDKFIEVQRSDLVAAATGGTERQTTEKLDEAAGGVLFVDEAYQLVRKGSKNDFGPQAVNVMMKRMLTNVPVIIVAGYKDKMEPFLALNAGLERRLKYRFHFDDYTTPELAEIFRNKLLKPEYQIDELRHDLLESAPGAEWSQWTPNEEAAALVKDLSVLTCNNQPNGRCDLGRKGDGRDPDAEPDRGDPGEPGELIPLVQTLIEQYTSKSWRGQRNGQVAGNLLKAAVRCMAQRADGILGDGDFSETNDSPRTPSRTPPRTPTGQSPRSPGGRRATISFTRRSATVNV